ncbi:uncharacterized protein LOC132549288 [Ylistrum balloti]|uniref:uncharacterized protein LOC132549288 n=1 Tax=Ylistrum balloti TaxID=509963 RepID=UPI002905A605|nr:uncharacterized protein LOC132549288 [Ylistrum balloti]
MLKFRADAGSNDGSSPEQRWRKVVIAMDGSEHAKYALKWYVSHIYRPDDRIILVHAIESRLARILTDDEKDESSKTDEEERKRLKEKLDSYQQLLVDFKLMGEIKTVSDKSAGKAILKAVEELNADVLVTGSRGLGSIRRVLLGSVSEYLLHRVQIPVVICRESSSEV